MLWRVCVLAYLGSSGKEYINKITKLINEWLVGSSIRECAMCPVYVTLALFLRKPLKTAESKDHVNALNRKMEQWENGEFLANIYLFKFSYRNTGKRCGIYLKLTIKTPERRHWRNDVVWCFFVNFEFEQANVSWVLATTETSKTLEKQLPILETTKKINLISRRLYDYIGKGNVHSAIKILCNSMDGEILSLNKETIELLKFERPERRETNEGTKLQDPLPATENVIFDIIDDENGSRSSEVLSPKMLQMLHQKL